jgi:hypothetical protein
MVQKSISSQSLVTNKRISHWLTFEGETPLMSAAKGGFKGVVELLLQNGADVNMVNSDSMTALHLASQAGHLETVQTLVTYGADSQAKSKGQTAQDLATDPAVKGFLAEALPTESPMAKMSVNVGSDTPTTPVPGTPTFDSPPPTPLSAKTVKNQPFAAPSEVVLQTPTHSHYPRVSESANLGGDGVLVILQQQLEEMRLMREEIRGLKESLGYLSNGQAPPTLEIRFNPGGHPVRYRLDTQGLS